MRRQLNLVSFVAAPHAAPFPRKQVWDEVDRPVQTAWPVRARPLTMPAAAPRPARPRPGRRRGMGGAPRGPAAFSLLELLVVIAILCVLLTLLLPSMARVQEQARRVHCLGNIRSLLGITFLVARDQQGELPLLRGYRPDPHWYGRDWRTRLMTSYGLTRDTCYCPSNYEKWNFDVFWDYPDGAHSIWAYVYNRSEDDWRGRGGWTARNPPA